MLLREVLNRIQFRLNQSQLEELDDETLDDDVRHTQTRHYPFCRVYLFSVSAGLFFFFWYSFSSVLEE